MSLFESVYRPHLGLLTDLYQLTMASGYWQQGKADQKATFHLFFRKTPFQGSYALSAGLETVCEFLDDFRINDDDIDYLATLTGNDGARLFSADFLTYLKGLQLAIDVDAMPEGTLVFGHEPMLRISGPLVQCQVLETALLTILNFQTLIATKASRICAAAGQDPVLEFGLRRAQGIDGGLSASRAAYIGGCAATSNVLAGKTFGIPVKGTHAHSWVMTFDSELEAFEQYASAMPNNCVFLVDTYDTIEGIQKAIEVGKRLRERGHEMVGIRLDSGDLAYLSIQARRMLDEHGFTDAAIVASNDLDEHIIQSLKQQNSEITIWGVGTKLTTAYDQPALGGVYKLSALQSGDGDWLPKIKCSEQPIKTSIPGRLQVKRHESSDGYIGDVIFDIDDQHADHEVSSDSSPSNQTPSQHHDRPIELSESAPELNFDHSIGSVELLKPLLRGGVRVSERESLEQIRQRAFEQIQKLDSRSRRLLNPQPYPVGLSHVLHQRRQAMIKKAQNRSAP